jgi:murein DD-endopeptidase MepM/ murein hydrolase activator NlpD
MATYKIKRGDTLGGIAKKYGTTVSALASANKIKNPNRIFAGNTLTIGSTSKPVVKAPAKPAAPQMSELDKWLAGDTTYQQQLSDFNRTKSEYEAQNTRQKGISERDYAESERSLNLQGERDRLDQKEEFGGRGILHSGVFAKALGDYNTDFNSRLKALTTGKTDVLGDLASQRTNFLRQRDLEMNAAKQDAIRRRAQKLGI